VTYEELKHFAREHRTLKDTYHAHRLLAAIDDSEAGWIRSVKVALLTSYTTDFIIPPLQTELAISDIRCEVYKPGFNQFRQEILNGGSGLYEFQPDVSIVAFALEDLIPEAVSKFSTLSDAQRQSHRDGVLELCASLVESYTTSTGSSILFIQNLVVPFATFDPLVLDGRGIDAFIADVNNGLQQIAARNPNTYVIDYARLVATRGAACWTDPRTYYTARLPVAQENWLAMAEMYGKYIRGALNMDVKCVVLDLDNTLWGGVLGEDGPEGIAIGDTYPGNVFRRFQEYLLALFAGGYILAISSKNDHDDVIAVLRRHPGMILREEHFAAIKANWKAKEENIREISQEIAITVDQMLFIDDNPVEIAKVHAAIPGIRCLHLQSPPLKFQKQIDDARCISKLALTEEDRERGRQYSEERKRREVKAKMASVDDFYRDLRQRLTIRVDHEPHRARIAQLSQRTNQFNMTTLRLSDGDVSQLLSSSDYMLLTADLEDRFGSSGTVVYAQIRKLERSWVIENFLMSCRVLGRGVEDSVMDFVFAEAKRAGVETVFGTYIPTKKNTPFADFYRRCGFEEVESTGSGEKRFGQRVIDQVSQSRFIEVSVASEGAGEG
jgi:FkbH-like protein